MVRPLVIGALLGTLVLALGGCGLKGGLDLPPDTPPRTTADAASGQGKPEGAAPKPHQGFILDGLLR